MNICVFCASSEEVGEPYVSRVRELGLAIGRAGHTLVFGGYDTGFMGVVAHGVRDGGGKIVGVVPDDVNGFKLRKVFDADEPICTQTIVERKRVMMQRADAFVVAPGGFGTLDELYEVLVDKKISSAPPRPVCLYNIEGFFDILLSNVRMMRERGFISDADAGMLSVADSPEGVLAACTRG